MWYAILRGGGAEVHVQNTPCLVGRENRPCSEGLTRPKVFQFILSTSVIEVYNTASPYITCFNLNLKAPNEENQVNYSFFV